MQQPNGFLDAICKAVSDFKDVEIFYCPCALSWIKNVQTGKWRLEDAESCMNSRPEAQAWRFASNPPKLKENVDCVEKAIQNCGDLQFCTGHGQGDTHAKNLSNGSVNRSSKAGQPYDTITWTQILNLVKNPQNVPKPEAQWFIPSSYSGHDARTHNVQRQYGQFHCLVVDIDDGNCSKDQVLSALNTALGEVCYIIIYSTKSSTDDNRKWRALIPLNTPISGVNYADTMDAFFDQIEMGTTGIKLDRSLKRPAQMSYLPNLGEHYDFTIHEGPFLDLNQNHPVILHRDEKGRQLAENKRAAEVDRERQRDACAFSGEDHTKSIIEHFNQEHSISDLLESYGYTPSGNDKDWRSPHQTSDSYATRDDGDHWISLSASDAEQGLGRETESGVRSGSAFDLYVHFEHGGDFRTALSTYALKVGLNIGGSELSHDALALDMGERGWNANARYVSAWGKWLFWTITYWQVDDRQEHMTRTRDYLRRRGQALISSAAVQDFNGDKEKDDVKTDEKLKAAKKQAARLRNRTTIDAVEKLAQSNPVSAARPEDFDTDPMLLGTPGGTVDLRTGELRPAKREDMITKQTAVSPAAPGATPKKFIQFVNDITDGDPELIDFIQRAAGYALTGETSEHKMFFLYGSGRNGKSVLLNTLSWIWGDYSGRAPSTVFLDSRTEHHSTEIAGLKGKRLVAASELPRGKTWNESVIKDLTGGDYQTARFMRQDFFEFKPEMTLFIAGNTQPSFRGVDVAIKSRVVLVPFTVTIPPEKCDQNLEQSLKEEGPEILRWAIDGALARQKMGLAVPEAIAAASQEYFDAEDIVGGFLQDETTPVVGKFTDGDCLYKRFNHWLREQGLGEWTKRTLTKELKARGYKEAKSNGRRGFKGLELREPAL